MVRSISQQSVQEARRVIIGEELNKELGIEVAEGVREAVLVETMEDYAAELEASYETLNQRHIEIAKEEGGEGEKQTRFTQMMEDRAVARVRTAKVVKGGVVTSLEEVRAFIPISQLSTKYVEKLEDQQGKYVKVAIITVNPERKKLALFGRKVEKEKRKAQKKEYMAQFKVRDIMEGTANSIKPYGVFIKLDNGVGGPFHVSQISTQRIKYPSTVLIEGQTVKVEILSTQEGRLSLSMKVLVEQQADREEHETPDYREIGTIPIGLGDLLKGLKLQT